jgi:poly-gamma-glutamate synthesis protein (capsule biosynthesis protein)
MMRRTHSAALATCTMKGGGLFAPFAHGVLVLAFMAQPLFAAETSSTQATAKPAHVHAGKKQKNKAHHASDKQAKANVRRPDTAGPLSLVVVGDIMLEDGPMDAMRKGQDPFAGFARLFTGADIRIGNLECVIATTGSPEDDKPNVFRVHPRALPYLKRHFDAVGLANNHSGDFGPQAFTQMLGLLKQSNIGVYGGGMSLSEAHTPWIIERKGVRVAILGYDEFQPRSFEADTDRPGVAWSEDAQVLRDIRAARTIHKADVVIPVMHWGWEEPIANDRQRQLARLMIDAGADAVIGGHPHQLQDTERYQGKPIFYSLGNFVFDGFPLPINYIGWALRMELDKNGVQKVEAHVSHIGPTGLPKPGKVLADPTLK